MLSVCRSVASTIHTSVRERCDFTAAKYDVGLGIICDALTVFTVGIDASLTPAVGNVTLNIRGNLPSSSAKRCNITVMGASFSSFFVDTTDAWRTLLGVGRG